MFNANFFKVVLDHLSGEPLTNMRNLWFNRDHQRSYEFLMLHQIFGSDQYANFWCIPMICLLYIIQISIIINVFWQVKLLLSDFVIWWTEFSFFYFFNSWVFYELNRSIDISLCAISLYRVSRCQICILGIWIVLWIFVAAVNSHALPFKLFRLSELWNLGRQEAVVCCFILEVIFFKLYQRSSRWKIAIGIVFYKVFPQIDIWTFTSNMLWRLFNLNNPISFPHLRLGTKVIDNFRRTQRHQFIIRILTYYFDVRSWARFNIIPFTDLALVELIYLELNFCDLLLNDL